MVRVVRRRVRREPHAGTADRARNRHRRHRSRTRARHRFAGACHRRRGLGGGASALAGRRARGRPIVGQRRGRHRAFVCRSARKLPQCAAGPRPGEGACGVAVGIHRSDSRVPARAWPAAAAARPGGADPAHGLAARRRCGVRRRSGFGASRRGRGERRAGPRLRGRLGRGGRRHVAGRSRGPDRRAAHRDQASHARGRLRVAGRRSDGGRSGPACGAAGAGRRGRSGCRGAGQGRGTALRQAAGHRMGDRRSAPPPAVAPDHVDARDGGPRRQPHHLGQQQHRRKLQRRHDAADVFVRAGDLRSTCIGSSAG